MTDSVPRSWNGEFEASAGFRCLGSECVESVCPEGIEIGVSSTDASRCDVIRGYISICHILYEQLSKNRRMVWRADWLRAVPSPELQDVSTPLTPAYSINRDTRRFAERGSTHILFIEENGGEREECALCRCLHDFV